ncbi:MAG: Zn-binding domain-containing protein [Bryobacteraceae bacterium]
MCSPLIDTPLAGKKARGLLSSTRDAFREAWTDWADDYKNLISAWEAVRESGKLSFLNAIAHQANAMWRKTVIEELATRRFLPRYGFPIGLQSLTSPNFQYDAVAPVSLERDGILAVSEYVPGSIVLAAGKTYASHGLVSFWGKTTGEKEFGIRLWKYNCLSGHVWYRNWKDDQLGCGVPGCESVKEDSGKLLLVPKYGYSTAASEPPSWSGNPERVGRTQILSTAFLTPSQDRTRTLDDFGGIRGLRAVLCEGGELLASNSGESNFGFAICTKCGYADSEKKTGLGREKLPLNFDVHIPLNRQKGRCWQSAEAPVLRNHHLAALQVTDLVELDFTRVNHPGLTEATIKTLGFALKLAGAEILELDSREIGVTGCRIGQFGRWGLQLFDSAAGGAGHAAELFGNGKEWLVRASELMFRNADHDQRCISACLRCLLISASQGDYEAGLLQRNQAFTLLGELLQ